MEDNPEGLYFSDSTLPLPRFRYTSHSYSLPPPESHYYFQKCATREDTCLATVKKQNQKTDYSYVIKYNLLYISFQYNKARNGLHHFPVQKS